MDTKLFTLHSYIENGTLNEEDLQKLDEAAAVLREGGLVAFPTETVYGLGGNALLKDASKKIYAAKGRPSDNPLIVHISDLSQLEQVAARIPREARRMAEAYWPGPLTMIFPKADCIPAETTGGLDTVAVRFPSHPVAMELIRRAGVPVAAPSANRSGRPSTTTARHCVEDLTGRVDLIVDGGSCPIGLESTILDMSGDRPRLLRPGGLPLEDRRQAQSPRHEIPPLRPPGSHGHCHGSVRKRQNRRHDPADDPRKGTGTAPHPDRRHLHRRVPPGTSAKGVSRRKLYPENLRLQKPENLHRPQPV